MSEFFADELAMTLNCSRTAATKLADTAILLTTLLCATWAALADGRLDWPRARALAAELTVPAREVEPTVLAAVEAAVLPRAHRLSIRGLQAAVRAELLRHDPAAADRRRKQAARCTDVTVRPAADGMAELSVFLPYQMATAIRDTTDGYARLAKAEGDENPLGQLRVGVLYDLVTRPWDTSRPPVTAHLTVHATLGTLLSGAAGHDACAVAHASTAPPSAHAGQDADLGSSSVPAATDVVDGCGRVEPRRSTVNPSPPLTCATCSNSSTPSAPAACRPRRRRAAHRAQRPGQRRPARDRHPHRTRAPRPPRLPPAPSRRLRLPAAGPAPTRGPLSPQRDPAPVRHHPRPHLPPPRLPQPRRLGRPRPRPRPRRRR
ncbi:DUF222 domain-containing protein [Blastococcus brunescens]|uniref:DUF222 domain-containing protein n=1 Tax=Blastococcus brunescens TaxID=1564165 RepID=A0ABZ1B0S9_9ACTN|nr:DUF222 domain-containing protein [Blastococcus sp. BMG 8361]WRL62635.1 DUF222 domain-containing protein [Blastococcus sp. BMG 8361]